MTGERQPPESFLAFRERYPELEEAWRRAREGEAAGPLDERVRRMVKLGIAAGSMRRGAVRSAARKALAAGWSADEVLQVVALAAT
ncbi:MAG: carboxymuconolactone decarboxylase family protein, partial [Thermoanaerobaculia bacterium]|nr:carboxymuconolactone decarboxylase family protein [Thermoanaerobaculia bacterium]